MIKEDQGGCYENLDLNCFNSRLAWPFQRGQDWPIYLLDQQGWATDDTTNVQELWTIRQPRLGCNEAGPEAAAPSIILCTNSDT